MKQSLLILLLIFVAASLWSVNLPFYIDWAASNTINHYPDRATKSTDWNEKYRIACGIDSLQVEGVQVDLRIKTKDDLIDKQIVLDRFRTCVQRSIYTVELSSQRIGYGSGYLANTLDIGSGDYHSNLYKEIMFNGVMGYIDTGHWMPGLGLGGNIYNQSVVRGQLSYYARTDHSSLEVSFKPMAITQDSHWKQPIVIGAIGLQATSNALEYQSDLAIGYITEYSDPIDQYEYFTAQQLCYRFNSSNKLTIFGTYTQQAYYPQTKMQMMGAYQFTIHNLAILPIIEFTDMEGDQLYQTKLRCEYEVIKGIKIGTDLYRTWTADRMVTNSLTVNTLAYYEF